MSIVEMKVPTIGESITEVTLSEWLIADGAWVNLDEPICEFESDKATLEFPAEASGILKHVAAEDDDLEIGACCRCPPLPAMHRIAIHEYFGLVFVVSFHKFFDRHLRGCRIDMDFVQHDINPIVVLYGVPAHR